MVVLCQPICVLGFFTLKCGDSGLQSDILNLVFEERVEQFGITSGVWSRHHEEATTVSCLTNWRTCLL